MTRDFDVAVAGAGPAGATSALLFAREGFRVALMDQAHFPRNKACAEYMSPGVWEVMRRLGLGHAVGSAGLLKVSGMEIVGPSGGTVRLQYGSGPDAPRAFTLPRRQLDAALIGAAAADGVEVMEGVRLRGPLLDGKTVTGLEGLQGGARRVIRASLVIVADGARSPLARALGTARTARWPVRLGLVAHFSGNGRLRDGFGQMHVTADGYCGVAPLPPDGSAGREPRLNVAMVVGLDRVRRARTSPSAYFDDWIAAQPRLRYLLAGCKRAEAVRGVGPIGARCARASFPGALLVGDAAGFFDPFTGEGIYRALRGAELAAAIGTQALRCGDLSARALGAYDRARVRAFRQKEAVTALVQLFVQYPALLDYALPRLRQRAEARDTLSLVLGDIADAGRFLRPAMLWQALRP